MSNAGGRKGCKVFESQEISDIVFSDSGNAHQKHQGDHITAMISCDSQRYYSDGRVCASQSGVHSVDGNILLTKSFLSQVKIDLMWKGDDTGEFDSVKENLHTTFNADDTVTLAAFTRSMAFSVGRSSDRWGLYVESFEVGFTAGVLDTLCFMVEQE